MHSATRRRRRSYTHTEQVYSCLALDEVGSEFISSNRIVFDECHILHSPHETEMSAV